MAVNSVLGCRGDGNGSGAARYGDLGLQSGRLAVAIATDRVLASPSGVVTVPATGLLAKGFSATFIALTNQTPVKSTVTISAESNRVSQTAALAVIP